MGEYLRLVETRYLELVGRGFAMSARDVGRLMRWHEAGVPLRVVMGALDEVAKKRGSDIKDGTEGLTLGHLERTIEAAMKRRGERVSAGVSEPVAAYESTPGQGAWRVMREALGKAVAANAANESVVASLHEALSEVASREAEVADAWVVAEAVDGSLSEALMSRLNEAERLTMDRELAIKAQRESSASQAALAEALAFERGRYLRRHFGVPELMALLLERGDA
jgi:hypothetical protein